MEVANLMCTSAGQRKVQSPKQVLFSIKLTFHFENLARKFPTFELLFRPRSMFEFEIRLNCRHLNAKYLFLHNLATQFWRKKVLEVAKEHRDITFAIAAEEDFQGDLKDLGLDESGEEINVGCFDEKGRRYKLEPEDEFNEDTLSEFIEDFKAGTKIGAFRIQCIIR